MNAVFIAALIAVVVTLWLVLLNRLGGFVSSSEQGEHSIKPPLDRARFRYSIRCLFLLTICCAMVLAVADSFSIALLSTVTLILVVDFGINWRRKSIVVRRSIRDGSRPWIILFFYSGLIGGLVFLALLDSLDGLTRGGWMYAGLDGRYFRRDYSAMVPVAMGALATLSLTFGLYRIGQVRRNVLAHVDVVCWLGLFQLSVALLAFTKYVIGRNASVNAILSQSGTALMVGVPLALGTLLVRLVIYLFHLRR